MTTPNKQKGNKLEYKIASLYNRKLDPQAKRMPTSGAIEGFKGDILKKIYDGWIDECKYRKKMAIYDFWKQTQDQAGDINKPVLHINCPHQPLLTVIRAEDYFDMREELEDWRKIEDNLKSEIKENNHWNKVSGENKIKAGLNLIKQGLKLLK